ncbi:MAG: hypothetical protein ACOH2M_31890 [Cypionkella sp.]
MNTQALQRITNPEPPAPGSSGERILHREKLAETTAKLMAETLRKKRAAMFTDTSPEALAALNVLAGRPL